MAVDAVVTVVVRKLAELLIQEALLLHRVHEQVKWIERELRRMQCFLKDADAKQKRDERVSNWVTEIRDISYETEDLIDTFIAGKISQERKVGVLESVKMKVLICNNLRNRHDIGKKLEAIKSKIGEISKSRLTYGIRDISEGGQETSSSCQILHKHRWFSALFEETDVVGLHDDLANLVERLIHGEPRRCVISIVGMGGSGKTTLAKQVYNCGEVKRHFHCYAFIYLSQEYRIRDILVRIIECVMGLSQENTEKLSEEVLGKMLSSHLSKKRYLVVIDDIWSTQAWDMLKLVLPDGLEKSRVVLTTRNREVALHADPTSHLHELHLLDNEHSWELFMKKVFPGGNHSVVCPSELEGVGRQILAKCGGLPLAIVVLGGLLSRRDKTLNAWSKVLDSVTWQLTQSSNHCMEILALSYSDLPYYLKPCFLYFGLFPEDYEIPSKKLIKLWIAEGFVHQRGEEIMEDVAEDYLEELIGRSMIQAAGKEPNGLVKTCRIHDLLRDLSISKAEPDNFFQIEGKSKTTSSLIVVRRLAIHGITEGSISFCQSTTLLRSMLCFSKFTSPAKIPHRDLKLLRVLDLEGANIGETLAEEIGELVHLRYLYLRHTSIKFLPSSIGKLRNLQTLGLPLSMFSSLPNTIWNLNHLGYLHAYGWSIDGPPRLNNLRNIQTLCIRASSWIGDGLDRLTKLRKLKTYGNLSSHHRSLSNSITKLGSLRSFSVKQGMLIPPLMPLSHHLHLHKMYLHGQIKKLPEFPLSLTKLTLWHSRLVQDPMEMLEKLANLQILRLRNESYCGKIMICLSGGFPRLKSVELRYLIELEEWIVEEGAMPNLTSVYISDCHRLNTVSERIRNLSK